MHDLVEKCIVFWIIGLLLYNYNTTWANNFFRNFSKKLIFWLLHSLLVLYVTLYLYFDNLNLKTLVSFSKYPENRFCITISIISLTLRNKLWHKSLRLGFKMWHKNNLWYCTYVNVFLIYVAKSNEPSLLKK